MPIIAEMTSKQCSHRGCNFGYNCLYSSVCAAAHGHNRTAALDTGHNSQQHAVVDNRPPVAGYRRGACTEGPDRADKFPFRTDHNSVQRHHRNIEDRIPGNNSVQEVLDYRIHASAGQRCVCKPGGTPEHLTAGQNLMPGFVLPFRLEDFQEAFL